MFQNVRVVLIQSKNTKVFVEFIRYYLNFIINVTIFDQLIINTMEPLFSSVFGRVAEIGHQDDISNLIADAKPVKTQQSIINNTTEVNTVSDNLIHENNNNVSNVSDNSLDANITVTSSNESSEPEDRVDNGTALILTPLIQEGRAREAKRASRVDSKNFLGFKSYSGFLTVNETYNSNLFFWYFPVLNKPVNASPWIIWLQGGPGASSMTGLFDEIGPFTVINDTLKREYLLYNSQCITYIFKDWPTLRIIVI